MARLEHSQYISIYIKNLNNEKNMPNVTMEINESMHIQLHWSYLTSALLKRGWLSIISTTIGATYRKKTGIICKFIITNLISYQLRTNFCSQTFSTQWRWPLPSWCCRLSALNSQWKQHSSPRSFLVSSGFSAGEMQRHHFVLVNFKCWWWLR